MTVHTPGPADSRSSGTGSRSHSSAAHSPADRADHTPDMRLTLRASADFVDEYRVLSDRIAAGIAVLACTRGGRGQAITVDSYLDVSWDPPTMAVSVYGGSRMMEALESAEHCTISLLTADQKSVAQWLGEPGQPAYGILDTVDTVTSPAGAPVIAGCSAFFELAIVDRVEVATHVLVIGEVTACGAGPGSAKPLVRWADAYGTVASRGA